MNFNTVAIRMAIGVIAGVQLNARLRGFIPSNLGVGADSALLLLAFVYLAWAGKVKGAGGDVINGVMAGAAAVSASRVIRIPGASS